MSDREERKSDAREYLQQGRVLLSVQKYQEALSYIDMAIASDSMLQDAHIAKGIALANMEDIALAKVSFHKAVLIDKKNPYPYFHLGNMAFMADKIAEGLKNYNYAIANGYEDADLYYHLGIIYEQRCEYELAIVNYSKAICIEETEPVYRIRKAAVQLKLARYEDTLETLNFLLRIAPDSFDGYHLSAVAYTMLGWYEKADEILHYAERLFPEDRDILLDRIRVLITKGDYGQAVAKLEHLDRECGDLLEKKRIKLELGKVFNIQNETDKALVCFEEGLTHGIEKDIDAELRYSLVNMYLARKCYENVLTHAKNLLDGDSGNPYILSGRYYQALAQSKLQPASAEIYFRQAIKYYRDLSLSDPNLLDAYMFRSMCHKELREYKRALEMCDYILLLKPENNDISTLKAALMKLLAEEGSASGSLHKERQANV